MITDKLMVGNFINYETVNPDTGDSILETIVVTGNIIKTIELQGGEKYYGIPLTPEILGKCGFMNNGYALFLPINDNTAYFWFHPHNNMFGLAINYNMEEDEQSINLPIKFLHQAQNAVYALTGTELQYNP